MNPARPRPNARSNDGGARSQASRALKRMTPA